MSPSQPKCRLVRAQDAHTGKQGLIYNVGISAETVGSKALHLQIATIPPGSRGKAHKHAAHETAIYALHGESGVWHGDDLEHHDLVKPGDFFYIPANVPHVPYNPSPTDAVVVLIARTDPNEQESVTLLPELDGLLRDTAANRPDRAPSRARPSVHPMPAPATLHMLCGKIASGKSTLASRLASQAGTILISEDHFLSRLYPDEIATLEDFVRCSGRFREAIGPHIVALLRGGVSVVLDFQANTRASRAWMRTLFGAADASHVLHYLDVADEVCLERLHRRNAGGGHDYRVSDEDFALFTSHFVPPAEAEGFSVISHAPA